MTFCVRDLKNILEDLDDNMSVELDVKYDERYVLTDISTYNYNDKEVLVIEGGYPYDMSVSVGGGYNSIKNVFEKYFDGESNNITQIVYDYDKLFFDNEVLLLEKSTDGSGELYGVVSLVYDLDDNTVQRVGLCKWFKNSGELDRYISNLSFDDFNSALRFGEIKSC